MSLYDPYDPLYSMIDSFLIRRILDGGYLPPELVAYLRLGGDYCFSVGDRSITGDLENRRLYVAGNEVATFGVSFQSAWGPADCLEYRGVSFQSAWGPADCLEYRMEIVDFVLNESP